MMGTTGEKMSFLERVSNLLSSSFGSWMFSSFGRPIVESIRKELYTDFPSTEVSIAKISRVACFCEYGAEAEQTFIPRNQTHGIF